MSSLMEWPQEICINITAFEDIFLENPECMTVVLETADGNVMPNTSSATVVFQDRVSCSILIIFDSRI